VEETFITAATVSPDGTLIAVAHSDRNIRLWSAIDRQSIARLSGHVAEVHSLAISPDSQTLASGSSDGAINLWRIPAAAEVAELQRHHGPVRALNFSPDGSRLVSAGEDELQRGEIIVWDGRRE